MPIPAFSGRSHLMWTLFLLVLLSTVPARAENVIFNSQEKNLPLLPVVDFMEDTSRALTVRDMDRRDVAEAFKPNTKLRNEFGYTKSNFWFRFSVENRTQDARSALLLLGRYPPHLAQLYYKDPGREWTPWETAPNLVNGRVDTLQLPLSPPGTTRQFLLRIKGQEKPLILALRLMSDDSFKRMMTGVMFASGLYFGGLGIVFMAALLMAVALRKFIFFAFSIYVASNAALLALDMGIVKIFAVGQIYWHEMAIWETLFSIQLFSWYFLRFERSRLFSKILPAMMAVCLVLFFVSYYTRGSWEPMHRLELIPIMFMATVIIVPYAAYRRYRRGYHPALIFLWSWPPFFLGVLAHVAFHEGWVKPYPVFEYGLQIGVLLQVLLGCYALADMIRAQRDDIQLKLLEIKQKTASRLEREVEERTNELAKANEKLTASEVNYRNVCERAHDGIVIVRDKRILYVNPQIARMVGAETQQLLNAEFTAFVAPEIRHELAERHDIRLEVDADDERAPASKYETVLLAADGARVEVEVNSGLTEYEGAPAILAIVRDIRERNRILQELEKAKEEAENANRAKSMFLATMSHEIRTPMSAIIGLGHLALKTRLTEQQQDYLIKIDKSASSLLRLLNDILDFSKIEADRVALECRPFRIRDTVGSLDSNIGFRAEEKGLGYVSHVDEAIPACLLGDAFRLEQVLLNLANNAVKFTDEGSVSISIVLADETDDAVTLECIVQDTGIGMSKEHIAHIFESFRQADISIARTYGGTGLGLSISKRLVELMGGRLSVNSEPNKGSVFSATFRFGKCENEQQADAAVIPNERASTLLAGCRLLLVEDSEVNLQVARELLELVGVDVATARNGQEAVEAVARERFDIVLMDMHMPVMDGISAAREIRKRFTPEELPILAMTANAMEGDQRACLDAGMNDHISKPYQPHHLYSMLIRHLNKGTAPGCPGPVAGMRQNMESPPRVAGLDARRGMCNVDNNETLYLNALRRFASEHRGAVDTLRELLRNGDTAAAQRLAHTLKGATATIGAVRLHDTAALLESALGEAHDERIPHLSEIAADEMTSLVAGLDLYLRDAGEAKAGDAVSVGMAGTLDRERLERLLAEIDERLDEGDAGARTRLPALKELLGPSYPEEARLLEVYVDAYDFDKAREALRAVARKLGCEI